jgi:hypothetical protein
MHLRRTLALLCLTVVSSIPSAAQDKDQDRVKALTAAHHADFDYLLGDWSFVSDNKRWGKGSGRWSAFRLGENGPVLDEYRVVGDEGETYYVTQTLRAYNARADRWELVSTEGSSGLQNVGTGHRRGDDVFIEQQFGAGTAELSSWRIHYYNIGSDHFSWSADRSTDGGKTWTKDFQTIEAHRIGPSRPITLTSAK